MLRVYRQTGTTSIKWRLQSTAKESALLHGRASRRWHVWGSALQRVRHEQCVIRQCAGPWPRVTRATSPSMTTPTSMQTCKSRLYYRNIEQQAMARLSNKLTAPFRRAAQWLNCSG